MPRQRTDHRRIIYVFPDDFPQRLERFREESGLSRAELARCLGTYSYTIKRWSEARARPNAQHLMALLDLADRMGLAHLLSPLVPRCEMRRELPRPYQSGTQREGEPCR